MKITDVPQQILDLIVAGDSSAGAAWGPLEAVHHNLAPVLTLTGNMLPASLWPWINDIAHRMQCPIDFVASAAVTMLGSVIGTGCAIRPKQNDSWTVVPNIWGAAVAGPGRMKSPAISAAMAPLHRLDRQAQAEYQQQYVRHVGETFGRKLNADVLKKKLSSSKSTDPAADMEELTSLSRPDLTEPTCKRYFTNNCTIESLEEILKGNPRGVLVNHDELTGLMAGFERSGREGERQGYLTAWNGTDSHRVDRIGRGNVFIPRFCVSVYGGIQPDPLEYYLAEAQYNHKNDGFLQRLQVMVYPDELPSGTIVDASPDEPAAELVWRIVDRLAHDIAGADATQDHEYEIPYFRFEARLAQPSFFEWVQALEKKIVAEDSPLVQEHLHKYRKLVPALALIFHLVDLAACPAKPPESSTVSPPVKAPKLGKPVALASLKMALLWAEYLESHARRVYGMATDYRVRTGQILAKKIEGRHLTDGFSSRDIIRKNWSMLTNPDEVKGGCDELEAANWIRKTKVERAGARLGRTALPTYVINPAVHRSASAGVAPTKPTKATRKPKP